MCPFLSFPSIFLVAWDYYMLKITQRIELRELWNFEVIDFCFHTINYTHNKNSSEQTKFEFGSLPGYYSLIEIRCRLRVAACMMYLIHAMTSFSLLLQPACRTVESKGSICSVYNFPHRKRIYDVMKVIAH